MKTVFFVCLLSVFLPLVAAAAAAEGRNEQFEIGKLKRVVDRVVNERRWMWLGISFSFSLFSLIPKRTDGKRTDV